MVPPGILFILYFFNDNEQWIKNDVKSHSWGLISRYNSGIWLRRLRKDRRNLCQVSQCPNQDSKQPVLWLMWMETKRLSVLQVQHTCISNSSKQKDPVYIYVTQCSQYLTTKEWNFLGNTHCQNALFMICHISLVFLCALIADTNSIFIAL